jgi:type II secretory pathway pseudopilin PulG
MNLKQIKKKAKWWGLIFGVIFLSISFYMRWEYVFESGNTGGMCLLASLIVILMTLVCGVLALPRWQGFIALAVILYAAYWLSCPTYAIS